MRPDSGEALQQQSDQTMVNQIDHPMRVPVWKEQIDRYVAEIDQAALHYSIPDLLFPLYKESEAAKSSLDEWSKDWNELQTAGVQPEALYTVLLPSYTAVSRMEIVMVGTIVRRFYYRIEAANDLHFHETEQHVEIKLLSGDMGDWKFANVWGLPEKMPANKHKLHLIQNDPIEAEGTVSLAQTGRYDRAAAVAYANQFWEVPNPAYPYFKDDCTNFISQCLFAGNIPMIFSNSRAKGWWYRHRNEGWSFSWAIANSLKNLLASGGAPFYAQAVQSPQELDLGDIICYDFDGDGRFQHNTIVVAKDEEGMPLVNAHTYNSANRNWAYLDSTAYTPQMKYAFFHIRA
ncbi:amidase domain-containing protein [Brevibacillus daliensis]|uniref:amidase domain-containing protein n=1 Tax=Brevibacillus daliensis TaxID=2892995 RepID=UPI001E507AA9|nr:amidase domain-containing protein [Brevibacillus daliensis]